jgi:hypothetical protein
MYPELEAAVETKIEQRRQRASTRVSVWFPVTVESSFGHQAGTCMVLSTGGAAIQVEELPPIGAEIQVEFSVDGEHTILAVAEVVNTRTAPQNVIGVRFRHLAPRALFALHSIVSDRRLH